MNKVYYVSFIIHLNENILRIKEIIDRESDETGYNENPGKYYSIEDMDGRTRGLLELILTSR